MAAVAQVAAEAMPRASVAASLAGAGLLALAGIAGMTYVTLAVALGAFVIAFGLPPVMDVSNLTRSRFVLALATLLTAAAVLTVDDEPALRLLPEAVAVSVIAMFLVQLTRADSRPRLSTCLAGDALGIGVITSGMVFATLAQSVEGGYTVAAAMAAIALSCLLDPLLARPGSDGWLLPAAALLGGAAAVTVNAVTPDPSMPLSAALVGAVSAGCAHAVRRLLAEQAAAAGGGGLAAAAAGLLVPGLAVFTIARLLG